MDRIIDALGHINDIMLRMLKIITIVCFALLTILITANVLVRFFPVVSLHWFDEIIEMLYAYLVFYGSAALWITKEHFSVGDWIGSTIIKKERPKHIYRTILEVFCFVFVIIFLYYSTRLTVMAHDVTNVFALPKRLLYSCMPISGAIMTVASLRSILKGIRDTMAPQTAP